MAEDRVQSASVDMNEKMEVKYNRELKGMAHEATHTGEDQIAKCIDRAVECVQRSQHASLSGSGHSLFDDQVLFTELYKFLQALGRQAGYQVESVRDIKDALSSGQLNKKDVETAYAAATGKRADFHQISKKVGRTMRIIELVAQENYQMYQKLVQVSEQYVESLNKARKETRDHEFRVLLDDLHREFDDVQKYVQFISQRQLKASYVPPAQDYTYDDQEKQLFTALQRLQRVLKFCFASDHALASKFVAKMKHYAGRMDQTVYLMRLIQKSPLVLSSTQFTPTQIVDAFERAYEQLGSIESKSERGQYMAKLLKITQKILSEKMTDRVSGVQERSISDVRSVSGGLRDDPELIPQHRSIYQSLTHDAIVKDQRINVFKHRVNHFYILIIKQFVQILDKKYYQDLAKMSQDLQLAIYELSEMQRELLDETETDINSIIRLLQQDQSISQIEYNNTIFRLKAVCDELNRRVKDLDGPFGSVVRKIVDLFANMIKFLDKTVKKGLQYSADDLLDVEHYGLESIGDDVIKQQNQQNKEWFAFITNYLTVFHMRQNLARVKRELSTIDEKTYYAKTTYKQLQQIYNECDKFYQEVDAFYTKQDGDKQIKCDPALAKYLYHVALRFQSSMFISKGRSTHPALNPRYFVFGDITNNYGIYTAGRDQVLSQQIVPTDPAVTKRAADLADANDRGLAQAAGNLAVNAGAAAAAALAAAAGAVAGAVAAAANVAGNAVINLAALAVPPAVADPQEVVNAAAIAAGKAAAKAVWDVSRHFDQCEVNSLTQSISKMVYSLFTLQQNVGYHEGTFAPPVAPVAQDIINKFYMTYKEWAVGSKFVGLTEELGANKCKYDAMSIKDEGYMIPEKPAGFKALEDKLDNTDEFQSTLYRNLKQHPFLHNVLSGNHLQARVNLQQVLYYIQRAGISSAGVPALQGPTLSDVDADEMKHAFLYTQFYNNAAPAGPQYPMTLSEKELELMYASKLESQLKVDKVEGGITMDDFIAKYMPDSTGVAGTNFTSVDYSLANVLHNSVQKADHGNKWNSVIGYHILHIFRLFGNRFCKFCPITDAQDADTFVQALGVAPNNNETAFIDDVMKNVNIQASRQKIAEQIYIIFTKHALQHAPAANKAAYKPQPFNLWTRAQLGATGKGAINVNQYYRVLTGQSFNIGAAAAPGSENIMVTVQIDGTAAINRLVVGADKPGLEQNRALLCVTGLMLFPFIISKPLSQNHAVGAVDDNIYIYRFADQDVPVKDCTFKNPRVDLQKNVAAGGNLLVPSIAAVNTLKPGQSNSMFAYLQNSSSHILSQLMGYNTDGVSQAQLLKTVVELLKKQSVPESVSGAFVSCMSDENLKEYLMPQIQLPFINPSLQDAFIAKQNQINSDQLPPLNISTADYTAAYRQILLAQYGRRILHGTDATTQGNVYSTGYQQDKRVLFDSMHRNGSVTYTLQGKMGITPMFGSYLFMPVLYNERRVGNLNNKNDEIIKNAYIVKREYDSVLNCFFDQADRNTARDYNTNLAGIVFANKRNAIYYAIDQPDSNYSEQIDRQSAVFKSHTNAFFEYQLFMAQQLQYFTVCGCKFIFDPVVRKQIFEVANKIYRGLPLYKHEDLTTSTYSNADIVDIKQKITDITVVPAAAVNYNLFNLENALIAGNGKLYSGLSALQDTARNNAIQAIANAFNHYPAFKEQVTKLITKPEKEFGQSYQYLVNAASIAQLRTALINLGEKLQPSVRPCVFGRASLPKGFYPISDDYISNQPRLAMGVVLKPVNHEERQKFIDACIAKDSSLITGDVLKVSAKSFDKLLEVLREDEQKSVSLKYKYRVYLSECIRLQYHANACVLEHTEPILVESAAKQSDYTLEEFQTLLKRVIKIKKRGYKALLQLAEQVDKMLSVELKTQVNSNLKFSDLRQMLDKLMLHSRTYQEPDKLKDGIIAKCMNVNQYLSVYGKQNPFNSVYRQKNKLLGKGIHFKSRELYRYDLAEYYKAIGDYIDGIEKEIVKDENIENFAKLFTHIYQTSDDEYVKKINPADIRKFMTQYLVSSAIDVDTSVLETDFLIEKHDAQIQGDLKDLPYKQQYSDDLIKQEIRQFEFKMNQKMSLVGIDAIFVPQNWSVSSQNEETTLVPRQANQCTQELDFLYNNIVNAMSQKLINTLSLHKLSKFSKNKQEQSILLPRILLGAGKRRNKSSSRILEDIGTLSSSDKHDFDSKRIELYYRTYLLCYYYYKFFQDEKLNTDDADRLSSPIIMIIKPQNDCPEGQLLTHLFEKFKECNGSSGNFTQSQVNEVIRRIDAVAGKNDDSVYNKLVEYVNSNYGVVSVRESKQYDKLISDINSKNKGFSLSEVYDRLRGIPEPEYSDSMLRVSEDETDPVPYIDTQRVKQYLEDKIDKFSALLKQHHFQDIEVFKASQNTLSRLFRNIRLEYKNQTREQKVNKLRHLINGQIDGFKGEVTAPVQVHERVTFVMDLLLQIEKLANVFEQMPAQIEAIPDDIQKIALKAQLAHVFDHPDLIDVFPASSAKQNQLDFNYKFETKNIGFVLERLGLFVLNTIKRNKKLCDTVDVTLNKSSVKLSDPAVASHIQQKITDISKKFQVKQHFTERRSISGAGDVVNVDQLGDYLTKSKEDANGYTIQGTYQEFVSDTPFPGYFVFEENKTPQTVNPESWSSVQNGIVTEHPFANTNEHKPQSVAAIVPGAPVTVRIPTRPSGKPSGGKSSSITTTINKGQQVISGLKDPANMVDLQVFLTKVANQNKIYCMKDLSSMTKIPDVISTTKPNKLSSVNNSSTQIRFIVETINAKELGNSFTQVLIDLTDIPIQCANKYNFVNAARPTGANMVILLPLTATTSLYQGQKTINVKPTVVSNSYTLPVFYQTKGSVSTPSFDSAVDISKLDFAKLPSIVKFTDRSLSGGISNQHTRSLGMDQLVYKAYDYYPDPTMQYNNVIKYLIEQTSVISTVPKAFAALFQGIWTGAGSQSDYEMIVQYKQHHRDDYRAAERIRIQPQNYTQSSTQYKLKINTHKNEFIIPVEDVVYDPVNKKHIITYNDPCVQAFNTMLSNPVYMNIFKPAFYANIVQLLTTAFALIPKINNFITLANAATAVGIPGIDNEWQLLIDGIKAVGGGNGAPADAAAQAAVLEVGAHQDLYMEYLNNDNIQESYTKGMQAIAATHTALPKALELYGNPVYRNYENDFNGSANGEQFDFTKNSKVKIEFIDDGILKKNDITYWSINIVNGVPIQKGYKMVEFISDNELRTKEYSIGQSLIKGVLYDGFQAGMPLYTIQEVANHNEELFEHPARIRTHYTSSVLHFTGQLISELHMVESEYKLKVLDAGKIPVLQHDTEVQIVSSCVYADMQLNIIMKQIDMQLKALQNLSLYSLPQSRRDDILKSLNTRLSYLTNLKQTIQRFRFNLEVFIDKKKSAIQGLLCDTEKSNQGMVSSFYPAIQLKEQDRPIQNFSTMETIVFTRYLHERKELDSKQMIHLFSKEMGQGIDIGLLNEIESLIWFVIQARFRLKLSSLSDDGKLKLQSVLVSAEKLDPQISRSTPTRITNSPMDFDQHHFPDVSSSLYSTSNKNALLTHKILSGPTTLPGPNYSAIMDATKKTIEFVNLPLQSLPEFKYNIQHTLPCRNPDIQRRIVELITSGDSHGNTPVEEINMLDIGIVPINLNMIKKDVGLFHIFFNSSMYSKFLSTFKLDDQNKLKADSEKDLLGMKLQDMALLGANSFLRRHISKHLDLLQESGNKAENKDKMMVLTKQDQFRYELHLRLAVAMFALANSMKPVEGEPYSPLNSQLY